MIAWLIADIDLLNSFFLNQPAREELLVSFLVDTSDPFVKPYKPTKPEDMQAVLK